MSGRFGELEPTGAGPGGDAPQAPKGPRFERLEIGEGQPPTAPETVSGDVRLLCAHCGRPNEREREFCWACSKPVTPLPSDESAAAAAAAAPAVPASPRPGPSQPVQIVLDGKTYRSDDPGIPSDVRVLIERVRREGYTPETLAKWRSWRSTRNSSTAGTPSSGGAESSPAGEVPILRVDGRLYRAGDRDLPPELREIFDYIRAKGVTPELLETLRATGGRVTLRPRDSAVPSDGDLAFWAQVGAEGASAGPGPAASILIALIVLGVFVYALFSFVFG